MSFRAERGISPWFFLPPAALVRLELRSTSRRARFLAEFTLNGQGEIPRSARNDSEGIGMAETSVPHPPRESHQAGAGARRHEVGVEITKAVQHLDRW